MSVEPAASAAMNDAATGGRKKILMLTTQLGYGGAETSFIRLANFLSRSMEVTVALFTSDYGAGAYAKGHEPLHANILLLDRPEATGRLQRWRRRIRTVRQLKLQHDATISFLSGPNLVNVLAGSNARTVVSLRGSRVYDPVSSRLQRSLFQYLLDPIIFHLAARIVPVSPGLRHEMSKRVQHKVHPISPFIDLEAVAAQLQEAVPEAYAVLTGQPVIIGVGRLSIEKGFHHLIRVFAVLVKQQPGAKLLLVGDGPMLQQLRAECDALCIPMDDVTPGVSSVVFAGYQANVLRWMKLARVQALTSATEGFPNVLLEGMASGLPVLAADTPWGARAVLDGSTHNEPYPTTQATMTPYGTLMPRIDDAVYEAQWVAALVAHLTGEQRVAARSAQRPAMVDIATVGAQWQRLIEQL